MARSSFLPIIFLLLFAVIFISGCGSAGGKYRKIAKMEEEKRQAIEQVVPEVFRDPLPYRMDRYEARGFSDEMMLDQVSKNRAMQDALVKLSIAARANIISSMKDYLSSHPVFKEISTIDTTLSLSEVFYEDISKILTSSTLKGAIASQFWTDEHGLIGKKDVTYCYAFAPKYPEILEIQALKSGKEEIEKLKILNTQQALSESARQKMNYLLDKLEKEIEEKEKKW